MQPRFSQHVLLAAALVLCASAATRAQPAASSTQPLTRDQMAHFLATARVVGHTDIPIGVTRPVRLTLDDGRMRHDAAFSSVEEEVAIMRFAGGRIELDFVDSYRYSLAAYEVAELLGLDHMMPVMVEREWDGRKGVLSWWLDVQMDEKTRLKKGVRPPDPQDWACQMYRMKVFTQLVGDTDRNVGNLLVGREWQLYMIDFTRAFRRARDLRDADGLHRCDRVLLARLRALSRDDLERTTKPYLGGAEIEALLARRDVIVARFDRLVAERGEERVLY